VADAAIATTLNRAPQKNKAVQPKVENKIEKGIFI
jgi:hypothetical protein